MSLSNSLSIYKICVGTMNMFDVFMEMIFADCPVEARHIFIAINNRASSRAQKLSDNDALTKSSTSSCFNASEESIKTERASV